MFFLMGFVCLFVVGFFSFRALRAIVLDGKGVLPKGFHICLMSR